MIDHKFAYYIDYLEQQYQQDTNWQIVQHFFSLLKGHLYHKPISSTDVGLFPHCISLFGHSRASTIILVISEF